MKKILAVASIGGHWVQLLRIAKPLEENYEVVYMSTHPKCQSMVGDCGFHTIMDFSRWNAWKILPAFFSALNVVRKENPHVVITTGAAPGLVVLFAAFCLRKKTVWIDSIANVNHLSLCGRVAKKFASRFYTQWKELEDKDVFFAGNVIG